MTRPLVGIDLAPARLIQSAPGTARLVTELAPQLARLSVDWDWVPLVDDPDHPLRDVFPGTPARVVPGNGVARRAWWSVGPAWDRAGCRLGFATTSFVPWWGPPCVANLFDSNLYEHGDTWRQSGRRLAYVINRLAADHAIHRARRLFVLSAYCTRYLQQRFPGQAGKFVTIPGGLVPLPPPCPVPPAWAAALTKPFLNLQN